MPARLVHGHTSPKHGKSRRTPEYQSWRSMLDRVYGSDPQHQKYYAGIVVCNAWRESFVQFLADMGPKPTRGHSIDRIDNEGDYEPGNCRWATRSEQQLNRRVSIARREMKELADSIGIGVNALYKRMRKGTPLMAKPHSKPSRSKKTKGENNVVH